ncbi:hypothetical protein QFC19_001258 [Naganishia cerealis]|uniref:Uncharacterized protein n=1 Tax=Naganishia cerealis TaxID=610337 RepID=A0ACC2WIP8_9TREE|nr:hypothetical protein QFC19_001258 [Naganishia cerealis]
MKVAIAQITSIPNPERNLRLCRTIIQKAAAQGAELVAFPESSDVIFGPGCESEDERKELKRTKAFIDGMGLAAKENGVWVVFGCHMPVLKVKSRDGETWHFGITICYDIRYPQLFSYLRARGAEAYIVSTAWFPTTRRHWDPLLTARAIDNQAYMIAPCQAGKHHEERESLGASAVVDPWGDKVVRLPSIADRKDGQKKNGKQVPMSNGRTKSPNAPTSETATDYAHNGDGGKTLHAPSGDVELGSDGSWEDLGEEDDGGEGCAIGYAILRKDKVEDLRKMVPIWDNLRTELYGKPEGR